jgi:UDP-N-acetylglucosamine--dolichyl-phosphate N-acetylglucosaminephosphotransferase
MWALIASFVISLITSLFLTKLLIEFFIKNNIIALDLQKVNKPKVANSGGIPVFFSILLGLMFFTAIQTFVYETTSQLVYLFAAILTIFLIVIVGFFDDLNSSEVIEGKKEKRIGLKQWQKPLLTLPAAIPLMVVRTGVTSMAIPMIGNVNFGLLYPLLLVPIGVVCASNVVNMFAGFNGSEAGMGVIYTISLGIFALIFGEMVAAVILFTTAGALIGFLKYNWYPAKILAGDSLTYGLGAVVASSVIIGNMERAGIIILFPFIIEFFLKAISKFKASCLGKLRKDGKLNSPYGKKIYSLTHVIMNLNKFTEKQVAIRMILIELVFCLLLFIYLLINLGIVSCSICPI